MFTIEYNLVGNLYPQLNFKYKGELEFDMCISGDSIVHTEYIDWIKLIDVESFSLEFGDSYGSHVDNGLVSITHKNSQLEFCVDGARGGDMAILIPVSVCKEEFYKLSKLMQTGLPIARKIIENI